MRKPYSTRDVLVMGALAMRIHGTDQAVRDTVLRGYKKCGDKMLLLIVNCKSPMAMMQLILEDIA
jgi:hypothetical protein